MLAGFDEVILATGVTPRDPALTGNPPRMCCATPMCCAGKAAVGARVVIIGAGGIGFDVAEYLAHQGPSATLDPALWQREWGVTDPRLPPAVWPRTARTPRRLRAT